ncbi:GroES-like protein [Hypoxylon trugodes]|uniref:GroES-like protein n=1 Tax=Hypoxylon trugodes TaxID=326681 RepID=UPI00219E6B9C|nr:GroES-like protein [Hypoxylon trugodes]KAI1385652.1 GroES-like protein [Hypoxylon trugodes]
MTMSIPLRQVAIVAQDVGRPAIKLDAPVPSLSPDMILVKTAAVAVNPVDTKLLDYSATSGAVIGHDFAGTIVALGADAEAAGRLALGDRVAGLVHGMNKLQPEIGAFAEYVGAHADLVLKIPDHMSFEDAASLGVGVATAALAIFGELGIPMPIVPVEKPELTEHEEDPRQYVLVAGGSTASGTRAIQLLKHAGFSPIATCSPANFELALRFGADKIFDYHSPTCAADIRAYTRNELASALDCVTQADTTQLCYAAIGRAGGRYVSLDPFQKAVVRTRPLTIDPSWVLALTIFGREVALEGDYGREARPQDRQLGKQVFAIVQDLLDRGLIDTHPIKLMPGGWEGVIEGVEMLQTQNPSGYKLVYSIP